MRGINIEESWATIMLLLIGTGGYVPILMQGLDTAGIRLQLASNASSPVSRIMIAGMLLGTALPVLYRFRLVTMRRSSFRSLLPYVAVCSASIAWSQDMEVSARKVLSLLMSCVFGAYMAVRFPVRTQLKITLAACAILAVLSVAFVIVEPRYALDHAQHLGAWQGVFSGKNGCAMVMAIGFAATLVYRPRTLVERCFRVVLLPLFGAIICLSQSSGALVVLAVVWLALQMLQQLKRYEKNSRSLMACLCCCIGGLLALAVIESLPSILKILHRDSTLTGRTDIWRAVFISIIKHPFLGYGFGAFWLGLKGESARVVIAVKWLLPNAHNGFLDVWLAVGAVGLACLFYAIGKALWHLWDELAQPGGDGDLWLAAIVILVLAYNMDESVLVSAPNLIWTLFVSAICGLQLSADMRRRARVYAVKGGRLLTSTGSMAGQLR
jgi:O-antigen ligase